MGDVSELAVASLNAGQQCWVHVGDEVWLVELDPGDAAVCDAWQQAGVGLEEGFEVVQWVGAVGGAGQCEVGQRANEHWADLVAVAVDLVADVFQPGAVFEAELLVFGQLGDDVVVVRVEPLRHCGCWQFGGAAGGCEEAVDERWQAIVFVVVDVGDALWQGAQQGGGVEHGVVEGASLEWCGVQAGVDQLVGVVVDQAGGGGGQCAASGVVAPVGFEGLLELTIRSDAWDPGGGCVESHGDSFAKCTSFNVSHSGAHNISAGRHPGWWCAIRTGHAGPANEYQAGRDRLVPREILCAPSGSQPSTLSGAPEGDGAVRRTDVRMKDMQH